jgi:hypothetical protein
MNPPGKKIISLFLVFSLMMLSVNLYAKERRGAELIITKKNGGKIEGELITVKPNSLLLLNPEGKDLSVDIEEIKEIIIVKKSKAGKGFLIAGGGSTLLITATVFIVQPDWDVSEGTALFRCAMYGLIIGTVGAIIGAVAGTDKTIQLEGMTDSEIQETLDKLRKKARIRDYK